MAEATLLVTLPDDLTTLVDEIINHRRNSVPKISIEHTPEELAEASQIQERDGVKAATKFLKTKEREKIKEARRLNTPPSRTAIVLEVLRYALPTYTTLTQ